MKPSQKDFIAAVLMEGAKYGSKGMSQTMLLKFIYLLDVYCAEASSGAPCSGFDWRFHHFGPYSSAAVDLSTALTSEGAIVRREVDSGDREFALLDWQATTKSIELDKLDIPLYARMRLANDIKKYRFNLPALLEYVYFHTTPMESASPGEALSFGECRRLLPKDIKPIPLMAPSRRAVDRARELLDSMAKGLRRNRSIALGSPVILDTHYLAVGTKSERDEDCAPGEVNAKLTFSKKN